MSDTYGKRYPGSGGARTTPPGGGADWHPLPEGTFEEVPIIERSVVHEEPGFFGRLIGRHGHDRLVEEVVGHTVRKHYR